MAQRQTPDADLDQPTVYRIRLRGQLDLLWSHWFDGLTITWRDGDTLLTGPVADQAALHGLIRRIRDLGVTLLSINRLEAGAEPDHRTPQIGAN